MNGRVLIIAGSDSGGGAGIQADIKAVTALGGFAMTAITALTAQNTQGVFAIHDVPPDFVSEQIKVVMEDLGADCIKIGMLHTAEVVETVAAALNAHAPDVPVVLDPVMVAKGGARLLTADAVDGVRDILLPLARVLTPNLPEAETLAGLEAPAADQAERLADALLTLGPEAVLVKGGHREDAELFDLLKEKSGSVTGYRSARIDTANTHGTGCTLASAIACGMAQGLTLPDAVQRARDYVIEAIRTAPGFGSGHGPLNHVHPLQERK